MMSLEGVKYVYWVSYPTTVRHCSTPESHLKTNEPEVGTSGTRPLSIAQLNVRI